MPIIVLFLLTAMLLVLWFDITRYIIPNWLVCAVLLAYPLAVWLCPHAVDWPMALLAMFGVFAGGYVIFSMRWMGGGDIKLIVACSLWSGVEHLLDFLVAVSLLGGVLSLGLMGVRKLLPPKPNRPRILQPGEAAPYGIAIALGFLWMLGVGFIPVLALPQSGG